MNCPQLVDSGVYVLGALPPSQRLSFEAHMTLCDDCRNEVNELAVLPGLLGRIDEKLIDVEPEAERLAAPHPINVLPSVINRVNRRRRVRRISALAGAVAVACLALVAGLTLPQQHHDTSRSTTAASTVAMHPMRALAAGTPVTAQVGLTSIRGGTAISLKCSYHGQEVGHVYGGSQTFALFVYPRNGGTPQEVGTWSARPGDNVTIPAVTSWALDDVSKVELRSANGTPLLNYNVT